MTEYRGLPICHVLLGLLDQAKLLKGRAACPQSLWVVQPDREPDPLVDPDLVATRYPVSINTYETTVPY